MAVVAAIELVDAAAAQGTVDRTFDVCVDPIHGDNARASALDPIEQESARGEAEHGAAGLCIRIPDSKVAIHVKRSACDSAAKLPIESSHPGDGRWCVVVGIEVQPLLRDRHDP